MSPDHPFEKWRATSIYRDVVNPLALNMLKAAWNGGVKAAPRDNGLDFAFEVDPWVSEEDFDHWAQKRDEELGPLADATERFAETLRRFAWPEREEEKP